MNSEKISNLSKNSRKKRCKWELIHAMLKVSNENERASKTLIQQKAYVDYRSFKRYFDLIVRDGFISVCDDCPDRYEITDKGKTFLKQLNKLDDITSIYER